LGGAVEIEGEETRQRVFLGNVGRPAIGGGNRGVEVAMRVVEPSRTLVVELGQGAFLQDCGDPLLTLSLTDRERRSAKLADRGETL
jgi:hypothetical protein